jgi:hypothetical protein
MATIIEELRAAAVDHDSTGYVMEKAADKIESNAKIIAEKDIEICSMIAVHNSDVDGMRLQEEKIADQKKTIAALRERNERLVMTIEETLRISGLTVLANKIIELHSVANEQTVGESK